MLMSGPIVLDDRDQLVVMVRMRRERCHRFKSALNVKFFYVSSISLTYDIEERSVDEADQLRPVHIVFLKGRLNSVTLGS